VTIHSVEELRALLDDDLTNTVLRLRLEMHVSLAENDEIEKHIAALRGTAAVHPRAGAVVVDRRGLQIEVLASPFPEDLPDSVRETLEDLRVRAAHDATARRAVRLLHELAREPV
jgi:hypothetical protein